MTNSFSQPVLAFGFLSPWLLWGALLAGIPILIHLLHRRNHREMEWAAMRFLLDASRKASRRIRLERLLLLLIRTLILLLLALAFARPYIESIGGELLAHTPMHHVIVVDASYSMQAEEAGVSLFQRAQQMARKMIENARQGDAFHLVRISSLPPQSIVSRASYRREAVLSELADQSPTDERGDLPTTLGKVLQHLEEGPAIGRRQVTILSDFQVGLWWPDSTDERQRIRDLLVELDRQAEVILVDLHPPESQNLAVLSLESTAELISVNRPVKLAAVVLNDSHTARNNQPVDLLVDGRLAETVTADLPAHRETIVRFEQVFPGSGEYELQVRIADAFLPRDNSALMAAPVREAVNVLLVNGRPDGRKMHQATDYLRLALAPTPGDERGNLIRPTVIAEGELPESDLSRFDVVFLCDVALVTPAEGQLLDRYVRGGGSLIYNRVLGEEFDLMPVQLGDRIELHADNLEGLTFDPGDYTSPIVAAFKGNPFAGLTTTRIQGYLSAQIRESDDGTTQVPLRYSNGEIAIAERTVDRGRSIFLTTSVDRTWGTWAVWPSFVPMMNELVLHAVSEEWKQRQIRVGESISAVFPSMTYGMPVSIKKPDDTSVSVPLREVGEQTTVNFTDTPKKGFYRMELGHPLNTRQIYAVNLDPAESRLEAVPPTTMSEGLLAGTNISFRADWKPTGEAPTGNSAASVRGGLSSKLLFAVLGLLLVEQLMAWRFAVGLVGLVILAGLSAVLGTVHSLEGFSTGVGILVVVGMGIAFWTFRRSAGRSWRGRTGGA